MFARLLARIRGRRYGRELTLAPYEQRKLLATLMGWPRYTPYRMLGRS